MKNVISIILAAFAFVCGAAAQDSWKEVPDVSAVLDAFDSANSMTVSIECAFTEEKYMDVLEEKSVSKGKFSFSAPDRILIEYLSPEKSSIRIEGDSMEIVSGGKTSEVNLAASRQYRRMFAMFSGNGPDRGSGKPAAKGRLSEIRGYEKHGLYMLVAEIRHGGLSGTVDVVLRSSDMSVESFRMKNGDDYTEFRFTDKVIRTKEQ